MTVTAILVLSVTTRSGVIGPGDPAVNGKFIKPYENVWRLTIGKEGGTPKQVGTWTDKTEWADFAGRRVLKRTQIQQSTDPDLPTETFVNYFRPETLEPLSSSMTGVNGSGWERSFAGSRVDMIAVSARGGTRRRVPVKISQPVFDFFGGMYGLIVAALPLKQGYEVTLPTFRFKQGRDDSVELIKIKVDHQEFQELLGGKNRKTWVATANTSAGELTFWVCKQAPYVIRLQMKEPGENGGVGDIWRWEMIPSI
jgi:hypothetical protein